MCTGLIKWPASVGWRHSGIRGTSATDLKDGAVMKVGRVTFDGLASPSEGGRGRGAKAKAADHRVKNTMMENV